MTVNHKNLALSVLEISDRLSIAVARVTVLFFNKRSIQNNNKSAIRANVDASSRCMCAFAAVAHFASSSRHLFLERASCLYSFDANSDHRCNNT